ncbi:MAG: hypothetical protein HFJ47_04125 [Clostridia bacterium]|nr:hypothetical protein [Clostridia bacterium]
MRLYNARLLTAEEIKERYPLEVDSRMARLTRKFVERGYDILYGENPNLTLADVLFGKSYDWNADIIRTVAYLYKTTPEQIVIGCYTDMSATNAIYASVRLRNSSDIPII